MKKTDIAYIAGVMDSDGYFTIKKSTYGMRRFKDRRNPDYSEKCGIKQVQPQAIKLIYENFGGYYRIEKSSSKNGKPLNSITLQNRKADTFIKTILPYLRIKKRQAQILLKLRQSINKGKTEKGISYHKDRWGNITRFIRYRVSSKEIQYRENLIKEVKSLNDIRPWSYIPK